jgi:hypothetical protein
MATLTGKTIAATYTSLLKLEGDTGTPVASSGANAVQVKTGDNDVTPIYLNTDKVGIGGNDIDAKLHITVPDGYDSNEPVVFIENKDTTGGHGNGLLIKSGASTGDYILSCRDLANNSRFIVNRGGFVGIGTDSPEDILEISTSSDNTGLSFGIVDASNSAGAITWYEEGSGDTYANSYMASIACDIGNGANDTNRRGDIIFAVKKHGIALGTRTEVMRIDGYGDVGIGTTEPGSTLHVNNSGSASQYHQTTLDLSYSSSNGVISDGFGPSIGFSVKDAGGSLSKVAMIGGVKKDGDAQGQLIFGTYDTGTQNFNTTHLRMIIDNHGNVGIGVDPPTSKLHIDQSSASGAVPVLTLDQGDVSEEMMEFLCTIGTGNAIEAVGAKSLTTTHFIKVTIQGGLTRYIPVGTIA